MCPKIFFFYASNSLLDCHACNFPPGDFDDVDDDDDGEEGENELDEDGNPKPPSDEAKEDKRAAKKRKMKEMFNLGYDETKSGKNYYEDLKDTMNAQVKSLER